MKILQVTLRVLHCCVATLAAGLVAAQSASAFEFLDACESHTYTTYLNPCPTGCSKSVQVQGECTAWGLGCPGPGTGTITIYKGTCVLRKGGYYTCENYMVISASTISCPC